jgi:carboxyl-terminal processing protease
MKYRWGVIVLVAVLSFVTGGWFVQRGVSNDGGVFQQARLFDDVLRHIDAYYVDSLGEVDLYDRAIAGLIKELDDPYTVLLAGESFRRLTETTTGNYGGLGIQIDVRDGWITVVAPLPDTPAERAGVESGDQIIEVEGESTEGWSSDQAVNTLRGEDGSTVSITVHRAGVDAPLTFNITRAVIHVRSVPPGTMFDDGIGYVSLNTVSEASTPELRNEILSLRDRGMHSLILDLRRNPGGLLDQGVAVTDLFLDEDEEVVSTRGRARGSTRKFTTKHVQAWPDMPIVVLVDRYSASAAEIIAGALQDHDRAIIVGETTFGKGLVQTLYRLGSSTALKLTTARWYTPSGRTIQRAQAGIGADFDMAAGEEPAADSTLPLFHTAAGRQVRGGGGIIPDVSVPSDTLSTAEQMFVRTMGEDWPKYRDAITSYTLELKDEGAITDVDFVVTPAMRAVLYDKLVERGGEVSQADFNAAGSLVDDQLGYEIARYVFGRDVEFKRRNNDDSQILAALTLLEQARTPAALLTLASEQADSGSSDER